MVLFPQKLVTYGVQLGTGLASAITGQKQDPTRRERRDSSYSERAPSPKPIGGPSVTAPKQSLTGRFYTGLRELSGDIQSISGRTQEAIGKFGRGAAELPGVAVGGVAAPVGKLGQDLLPLAALAAAVILLRK